jgi:ATP-dependent protease ClpP protease subunit
MKKLIRKVVNKWLSVAVPAVGNEIPDYEGNPDYDAELMIYDMIGSDYFGNEGIAAKDFKNQLDALKGKKVQLRIHSSGGNVYDEMAMETAMQDHGMVDTRVDGLAASAAFTLFQFGNKRTMSSYTMGMLHKSSSLAIGNSTAMHKEGDILDVHDNAIAKHLANRTGKSVEECMDMMDKETWLDGDACLENKLCDELVDSKEAAEDPKANPVKNQFDLSRFKHVPAKAAKFNKIVRNSVNPRILMNRDQMIALLKERGVTVTDNATDAWLVEQVRLLTAPKTPVIPTPAPSPVPTNAAPTPAVSVLPPEVQARLDSLEKRAKAETRLNISLRVDKLIVNDQIPAAQRDWWIDQAVTTPAILDKLEVLPGKPPGYEAVTSYVGETTDFIEIDKGFRNNRQVLDYGMRGGNIHDLEGRQAVSTCARANSVMLRGMIDKVCGTVPGQPGSDIYETTRTGRICDWLEKAAPRMSRGSSLAARMNATAGPYGSVSIDTNLQRNVILTESMRAFRRRLWPLEGFAHNFGSIPNLQGTDQVIVPYYPLYTTQSQLFIQSEGYQLTGSDSGLSKSITVGGLGSAAKVPGIGRAYQALTYTAYLLRRQPWVDIMRLVTMRVEQLALDVLTDVTTAWLLKANFGNAVWAGSPSNFDSNSIASLRGVAEKKDWPEGMRTLVIGTDYYTNLTTDPALKAFLNLGDTGVIREGRVGGLYGFADTIGNPRIPVTADGNLIGWIAYPSAVLVATAPILPAPGELKLMVSYDVIADDQTDIVFEYKYFGQPINSQDVQIVESNYGSGLGEQAALARLVAQGT